MDFTEKGVVKVLTVGYIYKAVDKSPEDATTPMVSLETEIMFNINNITKHRSEAGEILFHRLVAKFMFLSKH